MLIDSPLMEQCIISFSRSSCNNKGYYMGWCLQHFPSFSFGNGVSNDIYKLEFTETLRLQQREICGIWGQRADIYCVFKELHCHVRGGAFEMINENHFCKYCGFCSLLNIVEMLVDERWDSKIEKSITPQCLCTNVVDSRYERGIFRLFDPEKCHIHFVKHC